MLPEFLQDVVAHIVPLVPALPVLAFVLILLPRLFGHATSER